MARIAITGATGFVGTHLTPALARQGHELRLVARGSRRSPVLEQIPVVRADVTAGTGLVEAFSGCDVVVHLVAVIRERGRQTFDRVNRRGAENVAQACLEAGVGHLVHLSALGADPDPAFAYSASKWAGEEAVRLSGVPHTILRPSLLFGPGDGFFTTLTRLIRLNPVVPIVGDGRTLFQPLAISDLVRIVETCIARGPSDAVHEVGGPEHMSYEEIVDTIVAQLGLHRLKVHLPVAAVLPAAWLMDRLLPRPPVTPQQLRLLRRDNITRLDAVPEQFGFTPVSFPENCAYLEDY